MKRCIPLLLILAMLLCGCSRERTDVTPEEITAAYESAGYTVYCRQYDEKLVDGQIGYIRADHPDGDYIYFDVFETDEEAKAFKDEYYHPVSMGLFSAIFGQPEWQRWEVFGSFVIQYGNAAFFEPFEELLKENA